MSMRVSADSGAKVEFASCHDDEFPPSNSISTNAKEFWMLTGCYPVRPMCAPCSVTKEVGMGVPSRGRKPMSPPGFPPCPAARARHQAPGVDDRQESADRRSEP